MNAIEAMPASLLFAVICSYIAVLLFGMFCGLMMADRNKLKKQIHEYQREREKEFSQRFHRARNNDWDHPAY